MAWGGERGVVVADVSRRAVVAALAPAALYQPAELRARTAPASGDRQRSPSLDQVTGGPRPRTHPEPATVAASATRFTLFFICGFL